jgi:hypothetical protein
MCAYYNPEKKNVETASAPYGFSSIAAYYDYSAHATDSATSRYTEPPIAVVIPGLDPNLYSAHKVKIRKPFRGGEEG